MAVNLTSQVLVEIVSRLDDTGFRRAAENLRVLDKSTHAVAASLKSANGAVVKTGENFKNSKALLDNFNMGLGETTKLFAKIKPVQVADKESFDTVGLMNLGAAFKRTGAIIGKFGSDFQKSAQAFIFNFLGMLFWGMQLQKFFSGLAKTGISAFMEVAESTNVAAQGVMALQGGFQFLRITLGNILAEVLLPYVPRILEIIDVVGEWIQKNRELVAKFVVGGFLIGSILLFVGQTMLGLSSTVKAIVGTIVGSLRLFLAVAGGAANLLTTLFLGFLQALYDIAPVFEVIAPVVVRAFKTMKSAIKKVFSTIWKVASSAFHFIVDTARDVVIPGIKSAFGTAKDLIKNSFARMKQFATDAYNKIKDVFLNLPSKIDSVFDSMIKAGDKFITGISKKLNDFWKGFTEVMTNLPEIIDSVFQSMLTAAESVIDSVGGILNNLWDSFSGLASSAISALQDAFSSLKTAAADALSNAWDLAKKLGNAVKDITIDALAGSFNALKGALSGFGGMISNAFTNSAATVKSFQGAIMGVKDALNAATISATLFNIVLLAGLLYIIGFVIAFIVALKKVPGASKNLMRTLKPALDILWSSFKALSKALGLNIESLEDVAAVGTWVAQRVAFAFASAISLVTEILSQIVKGIQYAKIAWYEFLELVSSADMSGPIQEAKNRIDEINDALEESRAKTNEMQRGLRSLEEIKLDIRLSGVISEATDLLNTLEEGSSRYNELKKAIESAEEALETGRGIEDATKRLQWFVDATNEAIEQQDELVKAEGPVIFPGLEPLGIGEAVAGADIGLLRTVTDSEILKNNLLEAANASAEIKENLDLGEAVEGSGEFLDNIYRSGDIG